MKIEITMSFEDAWKISNTHTHTHTHTQEKRGIGIGY